jgi:hypothetical protein
VLHGTTPSARVEIVDRKHARGFDQAHYCEDLRKLIDAVPLG